MELKPFYHILKDFKFQSGEMLEDIKMEYTTIGKAKRDKQGKIINAVLFLHGWSGDYGSFKRFIGLTEPNQVFDKNEYFIISTTALGSPGSSSPSSSGLGRQFPHYNIADMINAQYRLLKEHLDIDHLLGVVGTSMGGFQSLEWGVSYPNFMDFIINIVTGPAVLGRNLAIFQMMNYNIETHPSYRDGDYIDNPVDLVKNINQLMFLFAFTIPYYHKVFPTHEMLLQALDEQGVEGMKLDARDVVWRNHAAISFDIRSELPKTRAKSLIIGIEGDEYFPPEIEAIPLSESIKNSELFIYKSELGHLGINQVEKMQDEISQFVAKVKKNL
jgi:homoserine O-acetyltransferase/O-succinyltransferase